MTAWSADTILREAYKWANLTEYEVQAQLLLDAVIDDVGVYFVSPSEAYKFNQAMRDRQNVTHATADAEVHYTVNTRGAKEHAWHAMLARYRVLRQSYTITTVVPQETEPVRASRHPLFEECVNGSILHVGFKSPDYEAFLQGGNVLARMANKHGHYAYLGADGANVLPYLKPRDYQ